MKLALFALEMQSLNHWTTGEVSESFNIEVAWFSGTSFRMEAGFTTYYVTQSKSLFPFLSENIRFKCLL